MIETEHVTYRDGDTALTGFLALDRNPAPRPGILVVHGGAGVDDHARGRALRLAEWGFVVFACDMYGKSVTGNRERVIQLISEFRRDRTRLCERAQAGVNVLKSHPLVDGRLSALGYCFGGMTVLELARCGTNFAEWGFVVFACDMYGKSVTGNRERVIQLISEFRRDRTRLCERAQAGVNVLKSHPLVDGRLSALGYCFGGMTVLELARCGTNLA